MTTGELIQVILMGLLVVVTGIYAWRTFAISNATKKQANASVKMAKEMRQQTIMSSRPWIIQKAVTDKVIPSELASDHFEIYNAGNGTAIEVQVSLLLQREPPYEAHNAERVGFLRAGDIPFRFDTTFPPGVANSTFYIVSEYQGISSYSPQPTWYQTWLPCKLSVSGKVIGGKLEFLEVPEEKRIGIFESEF